MFDGTLARATGKVSKLGAFMDSVFDRRRGHRLHRHRRRRCRRSSFADGADPRGRRRMGAAFMVSYTRAKSEGLGFTPGTGMAAVGIMPREVRLVILSLGLIVLAPGTSIAHTSADPRASPCGARIIVVGADHHRHPADPPRPQPGQVGRHHRHDPLRSTENDVSKQRQERQERQRRRPTPGRVPAGARTARSASRSSASATARAASSRAATTTRTPRRTTSSRA